VPKTIIARFNAAVKTVVDAREMKEPLNKQGMEPQALTPGQFGAFVHAEIEKNAKLMKLIRAKAEWRFESCRIWRNKFRFRLLQAPWRWRRIFDDIIGRIADVEESHGG
jgi:hypothetical protein